ncbi:MAG: FKBP-type peptidyl-prolyl cis-trans isomerase [Clostridium sp.]|nr:FKBP-type peptidyl-prolyl cis-trans isomerase [Clostridium sp.]
MKKIIALGMASVLIMAGITGCGQSNPYLKNISYSKYVDLCDYKGVEASKVTFEITDEEVQSAIDEEMYDYVTYDPITDRAAKEDDYANVTYKTMIDGKENENYSAQDEDVVIGEDYLFPEVEEELVGMKKGDNKKIDVEITEDYAYDDADIGKKATVDVTLNEISKEIVPEYNDDFVKENTEYKDKAEYEAAKKKELEESREEEYKSAAVQEIMQYLLDNSKFNGYPDDLYTECEENYNNDNEYSASMYGMELSEFEEMLGLDEDTKKQDIINNVNSELIMGAIAQKEKISCSKKEVDQFVKDNYATYGYESAEDFLKDYSEEEVGYQLTYQKVADFLYDNAKLTEISEDEYNEQQTQLYDDTEASDEEIEGSGEGDAEEDSEDGEDSETTQKGDSEEQEEETTEKAAE